MRGRIIEVSGIRCATNEERRQGLVDDQCSIQDKYILFDGTEQFTRFTIGAATMGQHYEKHHKESSQNANSRPKVGMMGNCLTTSGSVSGLSVSYCTNHSLRRLYTLKICR